MTAEVETAAGISAAAGALVAPARERALVHPVAGGALRLVALVAAGAAHVAVILALAGATLDGDMGGGGRGEADSLNVTLVDAASLAERGLSREPVLAPPNAGTIDATGGPPPVAPQEKPDEQPAERQAEAKPEQQAAPPAAAPPAEPEPVEPSPAEPKPPEPKPQEAKPAPKAEAPPKPERKQTQTSSIAPPPKLASVATTIDAARARAGELAGFRRAVAEFLVAKKPGAIGEQGRAVVWFSIGRNGRLRSLELLESSGNVRIDAMLLDHYRKLAFPPPPAHLSGDDLDFRITLAVH